MWDTINADGKEFFSYENKSKKTIAGLTALAMLSAVQVGVVSAEDTTTTAITTTTAETEEISVDEPELEEPMPEETVDAMIAKTVDADAPDIDTTVDTNASNNLVSASVSEDGLFTYSIVSGAAHITGYLGDDPDVVISDVITVTSDSGDVTEYIVNYIDTESFYGNTLITSISIPDTVVGIGGSAFTGCTNLTEINFSWGLKSINIDAFCSCTSLTTVELPDSLTTMGDEIFAYCSSLESITIPGSVTTVSTSAFAYCTSLTNVVLEEGVTNIGESAFYNCSALETINLPESSLVRILSDAFCYSGITSFDMPDSITSVAAGSFGHC